MPLNTFLGGRFCWAVDLTLKNNAVSLISLKKYQGKLQGHLGWAETSAVFKGCPNDISNTEKAFIPVGGPHHLLSACLCSDSHSVSLPVSSEYHQCGADVGHWDSEPPCLCLSSHILTLAMCGCLKGGCALIRSGSSESTKTATAEIRLARGTAVTLAEGLLEPGTMTAVLRHTNQLLPSLVACSVGT